MKNSATLSVCKTYRYTLTRDWGPGFKTLCWIMLNPSTADATDDDPTIRRVIHFSQSWGYDKLVVVNLYPFRSPTPADCRQWADWESTGPDWHIRDVIEHNRGIVAREAKKAHAIVAAWGNVWCQGWAGHVVESVVTGEEPWPRVIFCLGKNANGSPKHPMARGVHRVPDDQRPEIYLSRTC